METSLPTIAGFISTALFVLGTLPMLVKAFRTRNLASYSLGNILLRQHRQYHLFDLRVPDAARADLVLTQLLFVQRRPDVGLVSKV